MERVTIVGAGVMGSALSFPLRDNGCQVALCGTSYDGPILARLKETGLHPALGMALPAGVKVFPFEEIEEALNRASLVVLAVLSVGIEGIVRCAGPHLAPGACLVNIAKGVETGETGRLRTLPEVARKALPLPRQADTPIVAVAGPCKALELALRRATQVVFASEEETALPRCRGAFATPYYRVDLSPDLQGVEVCAAAKNGYAIGLGMCDGIDATEEGTHDNLRAAVFTRAVGELAELAGLFGGRPETAWGPAGLGDLFVTYRQGRNQTLGALLGRGIPAGEALNRMKGATVEGVDAVRQIHRALAPALGQEDPAKRFPLLDGIHGVLFRDSPVRGMLERFIGADI